MKRKCLKLDVHQVNFTLSKINPEVSLHMLVFWPAHKAEDKSLSRNIEPSKWFYNGNRRSLENPSPVRGSSDWSTYHWINTQNYSAYKFIKLCLQQQQQKMKERKWKTFSNWMPQKVSILFFHGLLNQSGPSV